MSSRLGLVLLAGLALGGCADRPSAASRADLLVLELGGDRSSLRQSLVAIGMTVGATHSLRPVAEATPTPANEPTPVSLDHAGGDGARPAPAPEPEPVQKPPEPDFFVVPLARGQTLIHLARQHLGNGNRYRELLTFNGWTDADARRLKDGQQVKIPRTRDNSSSR